MMKTYFFDTETTGNTGVDYLCQLAIKEAGVDMPIINELYKPRVEISVASMAVHHITNKMVEDKPLFQDSDTYKQVKNLFESKENLCIAHNAVFDVDMLKKEKISPTNIICTLKLSRYLDKDEKIESYRLQYLRYLLDLSIPENVVAHDAMGDVIVLEKLYERILAKFVETEGSEEKAIEKMLEISGTPSLIKTFKFGKYNGEKVEEVAKIDPGYLSWLLEQKQNSDQNEEDWVYTLRHYLGSTD